ncbi:hypothetical protein [Fictibacillus phosphorivorans]|uniref:hypothetical protein n=1 Tax=Fictibacillus phosphorivorans TaxID=1221500 RepID=UPI0020423E81|nr:hypothetical protein [Fictibacillus phosphorivorans]MCM3720157.1 hypothetical protein [Fictibacillus phosphorivorans]MCM3777847.1 hypothetical protein [Fictibacillus phosphorivorans]
MRIPSIILQGLIAGAILFIPNEVFAEKNNDEKSNSSAEIKTQNLSYLKQGNSKTNSSKPEALEGNVLNPNASSNVSKRMKGFTTGSNGSEKRYEASKKNTADTGKKSSQQAKNSNGLKNSVPPGQLKKNVSINQPEKKRAETSKNVHTETTIKQSVLPEKGVREKQKKEQVVSKKKIEVQPLKAVSRLPVKLPSKGFPQQPDSKATPVTAGQNSSHSSSSTKDAGNGGTALANVKAHLVLPLIFADSEKVSVYFSRMDLLRSQWVNAPPSMPPEKAL